MMNTTKQRLGKYELRELLGRGGMSEVWKALDMQLQRYVAIKILSSKLQDDPDFVNRFAHEARIIASLHHPNIVQIHDFHIENERANGAFASGIMAYMVMEYIQGGTLADYIHSTSHNQQFPPARDIVRLFTPISLAIDYAHRQGMIHRDIKPANILLDHSRTVRNPMGEPILTDFGLAKLVSGASQTSTGVLLGTPIYISPEQVLNRPLSPQTDLYALGVVLYELFTGVPPFKGESITSIMMQRITGTPTEPHLVNPNLPPALSTVILKSMAQNPQDRYPSASAMTAAIAEAFNLPVPEELQRMAGSPEIAVPLSNDTMLVPEPAPASNSFVLDKPAIKTPQPSGNARPVSPYNETMLSVYDVAVATPPPVSDKMPRKRGSHRSDRHSLASRLIFVVLLICLLAGSGLGALFLLKGHGTTTASGSSSIVGQAFFASSSDINATTDQGNNDEFQIDLHNIPDPQAGTAYYAWLLPDKNQSEAAPLLLGKLTVNAGSIHFLYKGDANHTNLLATTSQFLITEEAANTTPEVPTPDLSKWRYYAAIPQMPAAGQTYSLLDHLRHLLAQDPELQAYHLSGGLDIWTYRNVQKVMQFAENAQHDWNTQNFTDLHRQIVGLLDYLDGSKYVWMDVPAGTPIVANPTYARIGLLELVPGQENPPSYLYHIELHLNGVLTAPGATQYQHTLAAQIDSIMNTIQSWLQQARQDAIKLVQMDNDHLALSSSQAILNDLLTQSTYAFAGHKDPTTGKLQQGYQQVYGDTQRMALFQVMPYK
jgi:serine/threonine protein kinase